MAVKRDPKHPKKNKKSKKKHLKNENFEKKKKGGFFSPFSTHPVSFKKNVIFGHFSRGGGGGGCKMSLPGFYRYFVKNELKKSKVFVNFFADISVSKFI